MVLCHLEIFIFGINTLLHRVFRLKAMEKNKINKVTYGFVETE